MRRLLTLGLAIICLSACGESTEEPDAQPDSAAGKLVFEGSSGCTGCHGADGAKVGAPGPSEASLISALVQQKTDATLIASIEDGKGAMPGYKSSLSRQQIVDVVAYIRTLGK